MSANSDRHLDLVADTARAAGLAFLVAGRKGIDKRGLASWLVGPYRRATSYAPSRRAHTPTSVPRPSPRPSPMPRPISLPALTGDPSSARPSVAPLNVRPDVLEDVIHRARLHVIATLESAALPHEVHERPAFVQEAIAGGHVTAHDLGGSVGYLPQNGERLRLRERVLSLFACDYLARPQTYIDELFVCPWCEGVSFDPAARERGRCAEHERDRAVVNDSAPAIPLVRKRH